MNGAEDPIDRATVSEVDDLQFGEVQTAASADPPPSPDTDGHVAVRRVSRRGNETTVPTEVFVDLDTMLDMQEHAAEDTSVELGGILLGRRGVRPDGAPYVIIVDSLRARHYKATRGSFKFTHETWADLSRRRAELPAATEIIGWYHTHPGWSVFLSDLDVFICDHFFAHPDDVALVIDPTTGDTGLFVRRGSAPDRPPRRLDHYYLHSHRTRSETLDQWAAYFSGANVMSNPPAVFPGRAAPPVILSTGGDGGAGAGRFALLVGGMLGGQMVLIAVLVYLVALRPQPVQSPAAASDVVVRERIVDELVEKIATGGSEAVGQSYRQLSLSNAQLQATNLGLLARVEQLQQVTTDERTRNEKTKQELEGAREQLSVVRSELAETREAVESEEAEQAGLFELHWLSAGVGAALGAILAAAGALTWSRREYADANDR